MANSKSAAKSARATGRRTEINRRVIVSLRTFIKKAHAAISEGDIDAAQRSTRVAIEKLDRAGTKGYIHPNTASRTKSRMMLRLNKMMAEATS